MRVPRAVGVPAWHLALRVLLVLFVVADLAGGTEPGKWWLWPVLVVADAAIVAIFASPGLAGVLVLLAIASIVLVGQHDLWQFPMIITAAAIAARCRPRTAAALLAGYTVAVGILWYTVRRPYPLLAGAAMLCAAGIGLVARTLTRRQAQAARRITRLERAVRRSHLDERRSLADELTALLTLSIDENHGVLAALDEKSEPQVVRNTLERVDAHAREVLGRLRRLVSVLRPDRPVSASAPADLRAVVDDGEEDLVGHAFQVEVDDRLDHRLLDGPAAAVLAACLVAGFEHVRETGLPGGTCWITLAHREGQAVAQLRHEVDGQVRAHGSLRVLRDEAERLGGTLEVGSGPDAWHLVAAVPAVSQAVPRTGEPSPAAAAIAGWRAALSDGRMGWPALIRLIPLMAVGVQAWRLVTHTSRTSPYSVTWLCTWLAVAVAVRWPRVAQVGLLALVVAGWVGGLPFRIGILPLDVQLSVVAALLAIRRPAWTLGCVVGCAIALVPMAVRFGIPAASVHMVIILLGMSGGLLAQHFLAQRSLQSAELARLEQERLEARAQERRVLASELHDIVAHQLSLMSLEIGSHLDSLDPGELLVTARRVDQINASARADLDTLVTLLREEVDAAAGGEPGARGPEGGLSTPVATARAVAENLRRAGFPTQLAVVDDADACDPTTARTVSRVLREASTNIMRYADPGAHCEVALAVTPDEVTARVTSPLPAATRHDPHSSGLGLEGLAERVRLTGGVFTAGPSLGQWRVACELERFPNG